MCKKVVDWGIWKHYTSVSSSISRRGRNTLGCLLCTFRALATLTQGQKHAWENHVLNACIADACGSHFACTYTWLKASIIKALRSMCKEVFNILYTQSKIMIYKQAKVRNSVSHITRARRWAKGLISRQSKGLEHCERIRTRTRIGKTSQWVTHSKMLK